MSEKSGNATICNRMALWGERNNPFSKVAPILVQKGVSNLAGLEELTSAYKKIMIAALVAFFFEIIVLAVDFCSKWYTIFNLGHVIAVVLPLCGELLPAKPYAVATGFAVMMSFFSMVAGLDDCATESILLNLVGIFLSLVVLKFLAEFDADIRAGFATFLGSCACESLSKGAPPMSSRRSKKPSNMSSHMSSPAQ